jgi:dipeptidase E
LKKAYQKGIVLCGLSAGAICWFAHGNSDSRQFKNPAASLIKVRGLGLLNGLLCPHYHSKKYGKGRVSSLKNMMKKTSGVALAVDDFCALAIVDGNYKVITSRPESCAYKVYWSKGESCHEKIEQASTFKPIEDLFLKNV